MSFTIDKALLRSQQTFNGVN